VLALQRMAGNAAVSRMLAEGQRDSVRAALAGPARRLPAGVLADMEDRLGADFSDVRVHTGLAADEAAHEVEARAFTTGSRVVFGRGQYDPTSAAGKRVLAHELVHVLQQRRGPVHGTGEVLKLSDPSDRFEREADRLARTVSALGSAVNLASNGRAPVSRPPAATVVGRVVQRDWQGKTHVHFGPLKNGCGTWMSAELHKKSKLVGSKPNTSPPWWKTKDKPTKHFLSRFMVQGHLLNMKLGGTGKSMQNLTPITKACNSTHQTTVESTVKKLVNNGEIINYYVKAEYGFHPSAKDLVGTRLTKYKKKVINYLQMFYCNKLAERLHCQFDTMTPAGKVKKQHQPWSVLNESR